MKCADCRYFQPAYIHDDHAECRRHAPSLWLQREAIYTWPAVAPTSWCGQWESISGSELFGKHHKEIRHIS